MYQLCKFCKVKVKINKILQHETAKCPQRIKIPTAKPIQKIKKRVKLTLEQTKAVFLENGFIKNVINSQKQKNVGTGVIAQAALVTSSVRGSRKRCSKCKENFTMYATDVCRQCGDR